MSSAHATPAPAAQAIATAGQQTAPGAVVIPARNERETIRAVCNEINRHIGWRIIVADDASSDDTGRQALAGGATVLPLVTRLGAWGATQAGLRYALDNGYGIAITMDADGQHLADSIPRLLEPVTADRADVVVGSCTCRGSPARRLAWLFFRKLTGLSIDDLTSGFRVYNHKALELLSASEATLLEYQDVGVLTLLRANNLRIEEVCVPMQPRKTGHSRIFSTWGTVLYYLLYTSILCISKWQPSTDYLRRGRRGDST